MGQSINKLERYEPDEKIESLCTKYIYFLFLYNSYILILFIYTFFKNSLSSYGWLFFINLYFCVFPAFSFTKNSYKPTLLRLYNWMLFVSSIVSVFLLFEGIFLYEKLDLYLIIFYAYLTIFNSLSCWKITQNIFKGSQVVDDVLENLKSQKVVKNEYLNNFKQKDQKMYIGKGKTTKDSNYDHV